MEGKAAVFGDSDFVMPFSALGLDAYPVSEEKQEIIESARKIIEAKYALVIVAENIAEKAEEVFGQRRNKTLPCIIVMPFTSESRGFATKSLGEVLRHATGIDILKNEL